MNYMSIEKASVSNGTGFRVVLWVSGCSLHCLNCQNPETWPFDSGKEFTYATKEKLFQALDESWIRGITFSGGHPLEDENVGAVYDLIMDIRKSMPDKTIWLYTGLELDAQDFCSNTIIGNAISNCDVVVDGRYIDEQRDYTLAFRGSPNQRIIDVKKTICTGEITELSL